MITCVSLTLDQQTAEICSRAAEANSIFLCYNVGLKSCVGQAEWFPNSEQCVMWCTMLIEFHLVPPLQPSAVVRSRGQHSKSAHFVICSGYCSSWRSGLWENYQESKCNVSWWVEAPFECHGFKVIIIITLMGVWCGEVSDWGSIWFLLSAG